MSRGLIGLFAAFGVPDNEPRIVCDRTEVRVGGCVTLAFTGYNTEWRRLELEIDGQARVPMSLAGPYLRSGPSRSVLVFRVYDLATISIDAVGRKRVGGGRVAHPTRSIGWGRDDRTGQAPTICAGCS